MFGGFQEKHKKIAYIVIAIVVAIVLIIVGFLIYNHFKSDDSSNTDTGSPSS